MRVVVVGGGVDGLAAGLALARAGARVAVYERAPTLGAMGAGSVYGRTRRGRCARSAFLAATPRVLFGWSMRGGHDHVAS